MSLFSRISSVFRSQKLDRELDDELRSHLEMRAADNMKAGMSAEEARLAARRSFGNPALVKESTRAQRIVLWLESVLQDARFGFRMLRRTPSFTLVAILTMILSIGATTAIFALVESILLRPLPYPDADRLVTIATFMPRMNAEITASPQYAAWRDQSGTLLSAAAYDVGNFNVTGPGVPERLVGGYVTANFFSVLGVSLRLGRSFTPEEDQPNATPVAIVSHALWKSRFGVTADVMGKKIILEGVPHAIVGVMPEDFRFPSAAVQPEFVVPIGFPRFTGSERDIMRIVRVVGRMKREMAVQKVRADLDSVSQRWLSSYAPDTLRFFSGSSVHVRSLQTELTGNVQRGLFVVLAAVGFVLLIGCLNVASLQLARAVQRGPEVGMRSALGAGKGRLLRQLLTENFVLSFCGGSGGLALAFVAIGLVRKAKLNALPSVVEINVDARVLVVSIVVTLLSGLFFGLAPALWAMRSSPAGAIAGGTRTPAGSRHRRLLNLMVVTELSVALLLLSGAGLLLHSFVRVLSVDAGFNLQGVLMARINLLPADYPERQQRLAFAEQLLQRLRSTPGVESVTAGSSLPLIGYNGGMAVVIEGKPAPPRGMIPITSTVAIDPEYFHTLQIPVLAGRSFSGGDNGSVPVAIVNQAFVRQNFPGEAAVGKRFRSPRPDHPVWIQIVGLVGDIHHLGPEKQPEPEIYFPLRQTGMGDEDELSLAARTQDLAGTAAALRKAVKELNPNQPVFDVESMEERLSESLAARRLNLLLLGAFALLALVLAAVGIFGVLSYSVAQRTHEIGIRMALGSDRARVIKLVLREAVWLSIAGTLIGVGAALALTRFMASLLYHTHPTDPLTMVSVAALLIACGVLAGYVPALRASRVDPMIALRAE